MLHSSVELFTAAVVAGVNLSDHQQLFQQLTEEVKARMTPHLAVLRARVCNSGTKVVHSFRTRRNEVHAAQSFVVAVLVVVTAASTVAVVTYRYKSNYEIYNNSTYDVRGPGTVAMIAMFYNYGILLV